MTFFKTTLGALQVASAVNPKPALPFNLHLPSLLIGGARVLEEALVPLTCSSGVRLPSAIQSLDQVQLTASQ